MESVNHPAHEPELLGGGAAGFEFRYLLPDIIDPQQQWAKATGRRRPAPRVLVEDIAQQGGPAAGHAANKMECLGRGHGNPSALRAAACCAGVEF